MQKWTCLEDVPDLPGTVVTIGNFDGVHRGHQELLRSVVSEARERGLMSVVVTFDPHPLAVHSPAFAPVPITSRRGRETLLGREGVDALLTIDYTLGFAAQSAEEFVHRYIVDALHAKVVVVGRDVRFGRGNEGSLDTMVRLGTKYGFEVIDVEDVGADRRWSSTWVREALQHGDVEEAAHILGRYHAMAGTVVHGFARGRELGFPTANLSADAVGLMPADGVYAGWLVDESGHRWPSAVSIGTNPQFDGVVRTVEAHVIDRPEEAVTAFDLYDHRVRVEFVQRLRGMVAFNGLDALVEQMHRDVEEARAALEQSPAAGVDAESQA